MSEVLELGCSSRHVGSLIQSSKSFVSLLRKLILQSKRLNDV